MKCQVWDDVNIYVPNCCACIWLPLRRTLVQNVILLNL